MSTTEIEALGKVVEAISDLPQEAARRVLGHADEMTTRIDYLELTNNTLELLLSMLDGVRTAVHQCGACNGSRLVDGKPCPVCFELWGMLPEADRRATVIREAVANGVAE